MSSEATTSTQPIPSPPSLSPFSSASFIKIQSSTTKGKGKAVNKLPPPLAVALNSKPCEAINRFGKVCGNGIIEGADYCEIHEVEANLVKVEYERCVKALQIPLSPTITREKIQKELDMDLLELWMNSYEERLNLVHKGRRCYTWGRRHFSLTNVNDHNQSTLSLKRMAEELEIIITALNDRSYALIIQVQEAEWLLVDVEQKFPPCSSSNSNPTPPHAPLELATEEEESDPIEATEKKKRLEILELLSIVGSHAEFISDAKHSTERVRIIESICRRLITRDKILLVKAIRSTHVHVLRFFEDEQCCTVKDLKRIWNRLQGTEVEEIREGISDTFRAIRWEESGIEVEADGDGLQLLGGWIYKTVAGETLQPMGMSEWKHLYALCGCSGCAMRCCGTFEEWSRNRRLTCVGSPPLFLFWGEDRPTDAEIIMKALDVVNCGAEDKSEVESEIRKLGGGFSAAKGKAVFVERSERCWILLKMSINNAHAKEFIMQVSQSHTVLARDKRFPNQSLPFCPIPPISTLWFSRHRSAPNKNELKRVSWSTNPDEFGTTEKTILASLDKIETLETEQKMSFTEVYEILILDSLLTPSTYIGATSFIQFEQNISNILLNVYGLKDKKAALAFGEVESFKRGDLVFDFAENDLKKLKLQGKGKNVKVVERRTNHNSKEKDDNLAFKMSRSLFR